MSTAKTARKPQSMYSVSLSLERLFHAPTSIRRQDDAADTLSRVHRLTRSWIRRTTVLDRSSAGRIDGSYRRPRRGDVFCSASEPLSYRVHIEDSR